jgi:abortive infection bacteriophage resistance protein
MQYSKPTLSYEELAKLLIDRGLEADENQLIERLKTVNYYRLSAYLYPYRNLPGDLLRDNTSFDAVWSHYTFDRQLRIIVMDAIERVEVAVRTKLIHHFCTTYGPLGYLDQSNFAMKSGEHKKWIDEVRSEIHRSRETFIQHFRNSYGDCHDLPPLWMAGEIMSFGKIFTMFNGVHDDLRRQLAADFRLPDTVLKSWLGTLNVIRNICAHHGRLWNRELGFKPRIPRGNKHPQWHKPVSVSPDRIFAVLTILRFLLRQIAPSSRWHIRFQDILTKYPDVSTADMGFPRNWQDSPIWRDE